jgi:hypothetical protein
MLKWQHSGYFVLKYTKVISPVFSLSRKCKIPCVAGFTFLLDSAGLDGVQMGLEGGVPA